MDLKPIKFYSQENKPKGIDIPTAWIFPILAAIVWIANFWHSGSFGLYEDDWGRIPKIVELSWSELFHKSIFTTLSQGRPFHDGLIYLFSYLGIKLGGLHYAYWIGATLVSINACLFYLLLQQVYERQFFAVIGTLAFCLFPADTTRDYLTHVLGIQPSLAFLLIALLCYASGQKRLSYPIAFLCLIAYEPLFTVFLVAPLFNKKWDARLPKELFRHAVISISVLIFVVVIRKIFGEDQISNFGPQSIVLLILNPIAGFVTSLAMLGYRPIETLFKLNGELLLFVIPVAVGLFGLLSYLKFEPLARIFSLRSFARSKRFSGIPDFFKPYAKPIVTGAIALVLAYPLAMTSYGFAIMGRTTRVHVAATVGVAILCACLCSAILDLATKYGKNRLAIFTIAGFFALLVGFGLRVQQDYQLMWQHQRGFWTEAIQLCSDLTDGTVIFVEPTGLRDTRQPIPFRPSRGVSDPRQIKGLEWELPQVLQQIYQFPAQWQQPPRTYRLQADWQDKIVSKQGLLHVSAAIERITPTEMQREVESVKTILLETKNGKLTRRTAPLVIGNRRFELKQPSSTGLPPFAKKYFYNYLIQNPAETSIDYLVH